MHCELSAEIFTYYPSMDIVDNPRRIEYLWSDDCPIELMESAEAPVQRCGGRHFLHINRGIVV